MVFLIRFEASTGFYAMDLNMGMFHIIIIGEINS